MVTKTIVKQIKKFVEPNSVPPFMRETTHILFIIVLIWTPLETFHKNMKLSTENLNLFKFSRKTFHLFMRKLA